MAERIVLFSTTGEPTESALSVIRDYLNRNPEVKNVGIYQEKPDPYIKYIPDIADTTTGIIFVFPHFGNPITYWKKDGASDICLVGDVKVCEIQPEIVDEY